MSEITYFASSQSNLYQVIAANYSESEMITRPSVLNSRIREVL